MSVAAREPDVRKEVEERLSEYFCDRVEHSIRYGADFQRLWQLAAENVLGGKLVRPTLLITSYQALASRESELPGPVLDIATAVELLHFSFLLHDDVIDGDLIRRGRPNVVGSLLREAPVQPIRTELALHWARSGGILMGDLLLAESLQIFARVDLPRQQRLKLLDLLDHTIEESVAGEYTDVGLTDGVIAPDLSTILAMTGHKTATYSFELPLRAASILAEAPAPVEAVLTEIGHHLGLGYQLQDDLLSAFGNEHGKDQFSDLREGKQTAVIAHAKHAAAWPEIDALLQRRDKTATEISTLSRLLHSSQAKEAVQDLIDTHLRTCEQLIDDAATQLPFPLRVALGDLLHKLRGRGS